MDVLNEVRRGMLQNIGANLNDMWELIYETTLNLPVCTNSSEVYSSVGYTTTADPSIKYYLTIITCDSPITSDTEWGFSISFGYRKKNNAYINAATINSIGEEEIDWSDSVRDCAITSIKGGVYLYDGSSSAAFTLARRAGQGQSSDKSWIRKCRAGNYNIKVYGLKSL